MRRSTTNNTTSVAQLEKCQEWFWELRSRATGADDSVIYKTDEKMMLQLKKRQERLPEWMEILRRGASELDWEDEGEQNEYIHELAEYERELMHLLEAVPTDEAMASEEASRLKEVTRELHSRASGILEEF